jgi:hypothetical protein
MNETRRKLAAKEEKLAKECAELADKIEQDERELRREGTNPSSTPSTSSAPKVSGLKDSSPIDKYQEFEAALGLGDLAYL